MNAQQVDRFQVLRELGRGGMGVVHEVRDPQRPDARLALKLVKSQDEQMLERFRREAQLLARIRHTNVIPIHASGDSDQGPFIVMAFVEGENLNDRLKRNGAFDPREAARIMAKLSDAVAALHQVGVIHRDLKPDNALLGSDGEPMLIDFGLARAEDAETLTRTGMLLGTPAFMSPEQAEGAKTVALDERCDIYSLGATLYALLAGRAPFKGSQLQIIRCVLEEDPEWGDTGSQVDCPGAWAVCRRAMAKDANDRYPTARQLKEDLERVARGEEPLHAKAPGGGRSKAPLFAGLAALLLGGVAAFTWLGGSGGDAISQEAAVKIKLDTPTQEQRFASQKIEVVGRVDPPQEGVRVWIGKRSVVPDPDGLFELELYLEEGENQFEVLLKRGPEPIGDPVARTVVLNTNPDWYKALPPERRAPTPLPPGIVFGDEELEYVNEKDGSVLVYCPPGTFMMGTDQSLAVFPEPDADRPDIAKVHQDWPEHEVELTRGFYIGRYELTWNQFWRFCDASGRERLEPQAGDPNSIGDHPVHGVDWYQATAYGEWAGLRLPSDAEWAYAARGPGRGPLFPWLEPGDNKPKNASRYMNCTDSGHQMTVSVGSYREVVSPFGCFDVAGNVAELCDDYPREYTRERMVDPRNPNRLNAMTRGGGYTAPDFFCQVTARWSLAKRRARIDTSNPDQVNGKRSDVGFRVARDAR